MSFEDVLELRLTLQDELTAFREEMTFLAERITSEPWEAKFSKEIEYMFKHHVQPKVRQLETKLKDNPNEAVLRAVKNLLSAPTILSMVATIWAGMPPLLVMAIASGLVGLETALEHHFQHKKVLKSNGLSLLLQLQ